MFYATKKGPQKEVTVLRKIQGRTSGKRKVKMLAVGKILEVAEDPGEQGLP